MSTETSQARAPRKKRRLWTVGPVVMATLTILIVIRATSLHGLPDIGDPFDVDEFCRPIPDETNAFVIYKRAFEKLGKEYVNPSGTWTSDWKSANEGQRQWLESSREALDLWKQGTTRPDALYISPRTMNVATLLPVTQGMRSFARLAIMEGTRLEAEGDLNAALDWYLAVLRSSRHCGRRGVPIERLVGIAIGSMAANRLSVWAADPKVDGAMLRRALDAVIEAEARTPPNSDGLKCEYISSLNTIADPAFEDPAKLIGLSSGQAPWSWASSGPGQAAFRVERSFKREPERSRRVYRLMLANWLAYCDRPAAKCPPFANIPLPPGTKPGPTNTPTDLYIPEASAPEALKVMTPQELGRWFHSTLYAEILMVSFPNFHKALRRDELTFSTLLIKLANELHKKEKGDYPPRVEDLVGPYLKTFPKGYVPMEDEKTEPPKSQ